ncbi:sodium:solute symporter family protein [Candidatus Formimonas warabiya]|uniref:Sodium:solute symporter family protein n=1 Tax=Formimonas warabiya TaxID=1761012 RepID=A0A3G1KSV1_FORW1|nr:sodium:solute symporter family protein [Candidatus Formimonas warabiya]ATW25603.1 hypothetical protein DCMF_13295 [Candidatus Formimonas warabiya]
MDVKWVDFLVILLFFITIIIIGKKASDKVVRERDFFLGTKKMGRIPTALSMAANDFGGSGLVGAIGLTYLVGLSGAWWDFVSIPAFIILGLTLVGYFKRLNIRTIPELLERRYNVQTRIIAALLHLAGLTSMVTAQTSVASMVISSMTGIPPAYTILVATAVFVAYTARGGLLAVIWTDVFCYAIVMVSLLCAVILSVFHAGGMTNIVTSVPSSFWRLDQIGWMEPLAWTALVAFSYSLNQNFIQRIGAAKDEATAKFGFMYTGINYLLYGMIVALLGICAYLVSPGLSNPQMAITVIIGILPLGVKGLLMAGVLAATMSVSSSHLNAGATIFTIDIYRRLINPKADERTSLKIARISTVAIVILSILISYFMKNLINIVVFGQMLYVGCVFFPLILGLKFKWITGAAAISSIITGTVMSMISYLFIYHKSGEMIGAIHPVFVASGCSLLVLITVSLPTLIKRYQSI